MFLIGQEQNVCESSGGIPIPDGTWVEEGFLDSAQRCGVRTCQRPLFLEENNCARH